MVFTPAPISPAEFEALLLALCYEFDRTGVPQSFQKDMTGQFRSILRFENMPIRQGNDGSRYADVEIVRERDRFWFFGCFVFKRSVKDHKLIAEAVTCSIACSWWPWVCPLK